MSPILVLAAATFSGAEVLNAFRQQAFYLFLGAAIVTAALLAIAFSILRDRPAPDRTRKTNNHLLIYFGIFAALYGLRLWLQGDFIRFLLPGSTYLARIRLAISYLIPVPFVLYLRSAGLLVGRIGKIAAYSLAAVESILTLLTLLFGNRHAYDVVNNIFVIAALVVLIVEFVRAKRQDDKDFLVVRRGLLVFAVAALWDNVSELYLPPWRIEPIGFAFFLGCLGYVAARRTLARDEQLAEIQKELDVAKRIQLSILPSAFPPSDHFHVSARYLPMTSVAGDFYDYVVTGEGQAGLLIADVSGHGVPAALIASMVKLAAASQRTLAGKPSEFLNAMNTALWRNTQSQYVTAAFVHLDSHTQELRYSAAAHPPMLLLRKGVVFEIEENGLMLGLFPAATYSTCTHKLELGDRLLLYTDGLLEAANTAGEFFGREGLHRILSQTAGSSPTDAADLILSEVRHWATNQDDDLTLIVCDFCPVGA